MHGKHISKVSWKPFVFVSIAYFLVLILFNLWVGQWSQLLVKMLDRCSTEELRLHKRGKVQHRGINGSQILLRCSQKPWGDLCSETSTNFPTFPTIGSNIKNWIFTFFQIDFHSAQGKLPRFIGRIMNQDKTASYGFWAGDFRSVARWYGIHLVPAFSVCCWVKISVRNKTVCNTDKEIRQTWCWK